MEVRNAKGTMGFQLSTRSHAPLLNRIERLEKRSNYTGENSTDLVEMTPRICRFPSLVVLGCALTDGLRSSRISWFSACLGIFSGVRWDLRMFWRYAGSTTADWLQTAIVYLKMLVGLASVQTYVGEVYFGDLPEIFVEDYLVTLPHKNKGKPRQKLPWEKITICERSVLPKTGPNVETA